MKNSYELDFEFMRMALRLGEMGRLTAPPNPWVGCVIVKNGEVIGQGFHICSGNPHAEINALQQARDKAIGATVYITLEPCAHTGKTPPCTNALIKAKVARVVAAIEDPDPRVQGQGIKQLLQAGITVDVGIGATEVYHSLKPYLFQRSEKIPYTILKAAISIDGRLAAADGSSQWISTPEARKDVHQLRHESQAVLIGSGTALKDLPKLNVRDVTSPPLKQPLRVLLDSRGITPAQGPLFDPSVAPTILFTTELCSKSRVDEWERSGVEVCVLESDNKGQVPLTLVLQNLGRKNILQLLVEGGSGIHGAFIKTGLAQQIVLYVGPKIIGSRGLPLFGKTEWETITQGPGVRLVGCKPIDQTVRLDYEIISNSRINQCKVKGS